MCLRILWSHNKRWSSPRNLFTFKVYLTRILQELKYRLTFKNTKSFKSLSILTWYVCVVDILPPFCLFNAISLEIRSPGKIVRSVNLPSFDCRLVIQNNIPFTNVYFSWKLILCEAHSELYNSKLVNSSNRIGHDSSQDSNSHSHNWNKYCTWSLCLQHQYPYVGMARCLLSGWLDGCPGAQVAGNNGFREIPYMAPFMTFFSAGYLSWVFVAQRALSSCLTLWPQMNIFRLFCQSIRAKG